MSVTAFRVSFVALLLAGCATANDGVGTSPDGFIIPLIDGGGTTDTGGPGTPDSGGGPGTPDSGGGPGTPDASGPTMCTLVPQSGCSSGAACDLSCTTTCTTDCRAVSTPGIDTSTCSFQEDCAAGYVCLGSPAGRSCFEYCTTDSQCMTGPGALCVIQIVFGTPPMDVIIGGTPVKVCSRNCNPINGTGCPATWGCGVYQEELGAMRFFTECSPPGTGGQGAACTSSAQCLANYTCINDGMSTYCAKNCRYLPAPTPSDCLTGDVCNPLTDSPTIAGQEYGVCI